MFSFKPGAKQADEQRLPPTGRMWSSVCCIVDVLTEPKAGVSACMTPTPTAGFMRPSWALDLKRVIKSQFKMVSQMWHVYVGLHHVRLMSEASRTTAVQPKQQICGGQPHTVTQRFLLFLVAACFETRYILCFGLNSASPCILRLQRVTLSDWSILFLFVLVTWRQTITFSYQTMHERPLVWPVHSRLVSTLSRCHYSCCYLQPSLLVPLFVSAFAVVCFGFAQEEFCRCTMTQWALSGYRRSERHLSGKPPQLSLRLFVRVSLWLSIFVCLHFQLTFIALLVSAGQWIKPIKETFCLFFVGSSSSCYEQST